MDDLPQLPPVLVAQGVALRRETPDDAPFLEALYKSVRWPEFEEMGWPDAAKHAFLADQFRLQTLHYGRAYAHPLFMIVELGGAPAGRLYLDRKADDHRIVDVTLLPAARRRGIGGALLDMVGDEAAARGCTVSIHVEKFNPAQSLYARKGFRRIGENGPYWLMEWQPARAAA